MIWGVGARLRTRLRRPSKVRLRILQPMIVTVAEEPFQPMVTGRDVDRGMLNPPEACQVSMSSVT